MASNPRQRQGNPGVVSRDRGVFMISVAAELAEMHPQTLRMYEARGLIEPQRSPKGTRLYSQEDVDRLRRIQGMTVEMGLNLAGVEIVLELELELERMRRRVASLERQAEKMRAQLDEEIERVRRSFRAELVPLATKGALIRRVEARRPFPDPASGPNDSNL
ncbi:MAG TPA: helix-turn-helix transcriptional regulator [Solirubrobacteraceae bacterium]|nr:helix-turn-helix transcriptional regulator [Solirubrobacteraceae bacterium]